MVENHGKRSPRSSPPQRNDRLSFYGGQRKDSMPLQEFSFGGRPSKSERRKRSFILQKIIVLRLNLKEAVAVKAND